MSSSTTGAMEYSRYVLNHHLNASMENNLSNTIVLPRPLAFRHHGTHGLHSPAESPFPSYLEYLPFLKLLKLEFRGKLREIRNIFLSVCLKRPFGFQIHKKFLQWSAAGTNGEAVVDIQKSQKIYERRGDSETDKGLWKLAWPEGFRRNLLRTEGKSEET